ncbi:hypothetical protein [Flavobacterium sp. NRK1]|uniref:hypothetical protein n=1 Tax=Flavobacterium sp. NRK1 TaxID=2954929 RepID=UPI002093DFFA|nr:hypothetical protein [Flavobacterium sp. NRK1]MCO6147934.1 hypothetical protein [Flavobacterium sp. NRK1]
MKWSPLFKHYQEHEPKMLENISKDKKEHGYKITSRRMFEVEVGIMTDVIKDLNKRYIDVLYVYDALLCEEKDIKVVTEVMNRVILERGVKTSVKVETPLQEKGIQSKSTVLKMKLTYIIYYPNYSLAFRRAWILYQIWMVREYKWANSGTTFATNGSNSNIMITKACRLVPNAKLD